MPPPFKFPKARRTKLKKQGVPKIFNCVNCRSCNSVTVKLDRKIRIAMLVCKVCNERFSTVIHGLSEEIDVHGAWIDEKECSDREGSTKEPHTRQLTIEKTSKDSLTARQAGNVLPKTKEPDVESPGSNNRNLASERPAPINECKDGNPSIKNFVIRQPSNNGATAKQSDSKVPKTKEPGLSRPGPNGHPPDILAAERPAPINGPNNNNPSIKRPMIRQRRATQLITRETILQAVSSKQR